MNKLSCSSPMAVCAVLSVVAATACGAGARLVSPTGAFDEAPGATRQIVVLGDSLAVSPAPDDNFPTVLQARIDGLGLTWAITNAGVRGDTTTRGLRRIDALLERDVGVLVLALGANDGLHGVDLGVVERNLAALIERAQSHGSRVLLCGMETPPLHGWEYSVGFHNLFPRLATKYGVPLVPFLLTGVALNPDFNGGDWIHPNHSGAERIADTVWPYLEPLLVQ